MLDVAPDGTVRSPAVLLTARAGVDAPMIVEDAGPTWTFARLATAAAAVARDLASLQPGARVAVTAPNGGALVAGIFGTWLARGVPALVSPALPPAERAAVLTTLAPATAAAPPGAVPDATVALDEERLLAAAGPVPEAPRIAIGDPALVLFTSGTTGRPKGVVYSARAAWGLIERVAADPVDPELPPKPDGGPPRVIVSAPMVHVGALFGLLFSLWRGRALVTLRRFDPDRYVDLVRTYGVKTLRLTPTMMRMLLDAGVGPLSPPATMATTGTAATPPSLREEFEARFAIPVQQTYGLTEAGVIAFEPVADLVAGTRRPGSVGRPVRGLELEIRDEEGRPLGAGAEGEIWVRREDIAPRLLGDDDVRMDREGWLATGDIGRVDEVGYLFVTGRARELIIRGGFNVVPAEVEAQLVAHPSVAEAAVAGVPDRRLGEVPHAWVRLATGAPPAGAADLAGWLRERIAPYKIPVAFHVVEDFPRTETGKIRKAALVLQQAAEEATG